MPGLCFNFFLQETVDLSSASYLFFLKKKTGDVSPVGPILGDQRLKIQTMSFVLPKNKPKIPRKTPYTY